MRLILLWGLAIGVAIACVDMLRGEATRTISDEDLRAAIDVIDELATLGLTGWVGFRVGGALGELRPGLEAAVLAGSLAGLLDVVYSVVRPIEPMTPEDLVALVAYNIVIAAAAGALGAWVGSVRRVRPPKR
jgi:hypothetical protein